MLKGKNISLRARSEVLGAKGMTDFITAAFVAGGLAMPPKQYVHEPTVPYRIERVDPDVLIANCGQKPNETVLGCYVAWYNSTIYLRNDMSADAERLVLRHEIGHVNGWEHGR